MKTSHRGITLGLWLEMGLVAALMAIDSVGGLAAVLVAATLILLVGRAMETLVVRAVSRLFSSGTPLPTCSYVSRKGVVYSLARPRWRADGNGPPSPLMLTLLPGITRRDINVKERSLWRYAKSFPLRCESPISLGEGCTPLVRRYFGGHNVLFKCEWYNPTCSFKDRGTSVMLSLLRDQGITHVLEDSSGNGGASVSCYSAAGGLTATIMAPESTSAAKTVQMRAHGASVELIPGSRQATADAAVEAHGRDGGQLFYASHNW